MKKGYILLEVIVSISIIMVIIMCLSEVIVAVHSAKSDIEDRVELNQQIEEIDYQIKNLIESCVNIINVTTLDGYVVNSLQYDKVYDVSSIKLNFKTKENEDDLNLKNKEISLKSQKNKLFINTLENDNSSEGGGYEIGDYVEKLSIKLETPKLVSIVLYLKKNDVSLQKELKLYIRYDQNV